MIEFSMQDLLEYIPKLILPFVLGCVFVEIYKHVAQLERTRGASYWFICYIIGYILETITDLLPLTKSSEPLTNIIKTVICIALGFILGQMICSKPVKWLLRHVFRIKRTTIRSFWENAVDLSLGTHIIVHLRDSKVTIWGQIHSFDEYSDNPRIGISAPKIYLDDGSPIDLDIFDAYPEMKRQIFIKPDQCTLMEFLYRDGSSIFINPKAKPTKKEQQMIEKANQQFTQGTQQGSKGARGINNHDKVSSQAD